MTAVIQAREISFSYPGAASPVVHGWTADFHKGVFHAMTGPSGCGKSTRLYALALMAKISSGDLLLDGRRVDHLTDAARASIRAAHFGFVFQDAALDSTRTVLDNVVEGALYRGEDARKLYGKAEQLLQRLDVDVPLNRRPGQISGGQAQRIAVCRALVGSPRVIFADEPTGNLDPLSAAAVLEALRAQASAGACVLVVTHDERVAQVADVRHDLLSAPESQ